VHQRDNSVYTEIKVQTAILWNSQQVDFMKVMAPLIFAYCESLSGVLRPGSTGFQDKCQPSYLQHISAKECISDFQSALKGCSTFVNSYGFLVDHAH